MEKQFIRVFELPENLYLSGAPLLIAKGVLLKDTDTQKIIAQLKFSNISETTIRAVTVQLSMRDVYGQSISDTVIHTYLDFNAKYGKSFGEKKPVFLPDDSVRSYTVCVTKVLFADGTIWESEPKEWTCLPQPQLLSYYLLNPELVQIYKEQIHKPLPHMSAEYVPTSDRDLWFCSCGHWNKADNKQCGYCQKELNDQLEKLDKDMLTNCLADKENGQRYSAAKTIAENALASQNCKKLRTAISLFEALQGYGDSQKCFNEYSIQLKKLESDIRQKTLELEKKKKRTRFVRITVVIGICLCAVAVVYCLITKVFEGSDEKMTDAQITAVRNTPIGGEIAFEKYEQDAIEGNSKEDIEQIV